MKKKKKKGKCVRTQTFDELENSSMSSSPYRASKHREQQLYFILPEFRNERVAQPVQIFFFLLDKSNEPRYIDL